MISLNVRQHWLPTLQFTELDIVEILYVRTFSGNMIKVSLMNNKAFSRHAISDNLVQGLSFIYFFLSYQWMNIADLQSCVETSDQRN
jgi:hypothetical protein